MNLTLIYNNVTSFTSWILPMLSWFYVQGRYLSCSRTILVVFIHRNPLTPKKCILRRQKDLIIFGQFPTKLVTVPGGRTAIDNDPADKGGKSPCNGKLESFTANGRNIHKITTLFNVKYLTKMY